MTIFDYVSLAAEVESREERQVGGASGDMNVDCYPNLLDPMVVERRSRTVCLTRPFQACLSCSHSTFTLVFKADRQARFEQVACPRWASAADRLNGKSPREYVATELATCEASPFEFCPSCPSVRNVARNGADKRAPGWYGRWHRLSREEYADG